MEFGPQVVSVAGGQNVIWSEAGHHQDANVTLGTPVVIKREPGTAPNEIFVCGWCQIEFFDQEQCNEHISLHHTQPVGCQLVKQEPPDPEMSNVRNSAHIQPNVQYSYSNHGVDNILRVEPTATVNRGQPVEISPTTVNQTRRPSVIKHARMYPPVSTEIPETDDDITVVAESIVTTVPGEQEDSNASSQSLQALKSVRISSLSKNTDKTPISTSHKTTPSSVPSKTNSQTTASRSCSKEMVCEYCGARFYHPKTLSNHILAQHNQNPINAGLHKYATMMLFVCDLCGARFTRQKGLADHTKLQHKVELAMSIDLPCFTCDATFYSYKNMEEHVVRLKHHIQWYCFLCTSYFDEESELRGHDCPRTYDSPDEDTPEEIGEGVWVCKKCSKIFYGSKVYSKHIVHCKFSEYCPGCKFNFKTVESLVEHSCNPEDVRSNRVYCKYCGWSSSSSMMPSFIQHETKCEVNTKYQQKPFIVPPLRTAEETAAKESATTKRSSIPKVSTAKESTTATESSTTKVSTTANESTTAKELSTTKKTTTAQEATTAEKNYHTEGGMPSIQQTVKRGRGRPRRIQINDVMKNPTPVSDSAAISKGGDDAVIAQADSIIDSSNDSSQSVSLVCDTTAEAQSHSNTEKTHPTASKNTIAPLYPVQCFSVVRPADSSTDHTVELQPAPMMVANSSVLPASIPLIIARQEVSLFNTDAATSIPVVGVTQLDPIVTGGLSLEDDDDVHLTKDVEVEFVEKVVAPELTKKTAKPSKTKTVPKVGLKVAQKAKQQSKRKQPLVPREEDIEIVEDTSSPRRWRCVVCTVNGVPSLGDSCTGCKTSFTRNLRSRSRYPLRNNDVIKKENFGWWNCAHCNVSFVSQNGGVCSTCQQECTMEECSICESGVKPSSSTRTLRKRSSSGHVQGPLRKHVHFLSDKVEAARCFEDIGGDTTQWCGKCGFSFSLSRFGTHPCRILCRHLDSCYVLLERIDRMLNPIEAKDVIKFDGCQVILEKVDKFASLTTKWMPDELKASSSPPQEALSPETSETSEEEPKITFDSETVKDKSVTKKRMPETPAEKLEPSTSLLQETLSNKISETSKEKPERAVQQRKQRKTAKIKEVVQEDAFQSDMVEANEEMVGESQGDNRSQQLLVGKDNEISVNSEPSSSSGWKSLGWKNCTMNSIEVPKIVYNHNCEKCGAVFETKAMLNWHIQTHDEYRPAVCGHCGSRFKSGHNLKEHIRFYHLKGQVPCFKCDKTFKTGTELRKHVKTHTTRYKWTNRKVKPLQPQVETVEMDVTRFVSVDMPVDGRPSSGTTYQSISETL